MKLFLSIFFAILAAAAVIGAALLAKERLDNWKLELQSCNARGEMLLAKSQSLIGATSVAEAEANAKLAAALVPEGKAIDARIRYLLEHKPFGLPLTASEQRQLDEYKRSTSKP